MKFTTRLKYMRRGLVDLLSAIGGFLLQIGVPVIAAILLITVMSFAPWWVSVLFCIIVGLGIYLWIKADIDYKVDYETSKDMLHDKYYEFTNLWLCFMNEGKLCKEIQRLMEEHYKKYKMLLDYHKLLYGEDVTYQRYNGCIDTFIKNCEMQEQMERERQERRAAELKEAGGNGEITEKTFLI